MPGVTTDNALVLLERRLDNVVYRSGLAATRMQARQMVGHGHFMLSGRKVTIPSIEISSGDALSLTPRAAKSPLYAGAAKSQPAQWLTVNGTNISVARLPESSEAESIVDIQQVLEYFSR